MIVMPAFQFVAMAPGLDLGYPLMWPLLGGDPQQVVVRSGIVIYQYQVLPNYVFNQFLNSVSKSVECVRIWFPYMEYSSSVNLSV